MPLLQDGMLALLQKITDQPSLHMVAQPSSAHHSDGTGEASAPIGTSCAIIWNSSEWPHCCLQASLQSIPHITSVTLGISSSNAFPHAKELALTVSSMHLP